jgi:hypothetical protein
VLSLARSRAVESPPGEDGLKALWHPCAAAGADLATYLDGRGRVQRQELILLGDFLLWTRQGGLRTGAVTPEPPSAAGRPLSASVVFDAALQPVRILRVDAALAGYKGGDRALLHLQEVVRQARQRVGGSASHAPQAAPQAAPAEPLTPLAAGLSASARAGLPPRARPAPAQAPVLAAPPPPAPAARASAEAAAAGAPAADAHPGLPLPWVAASALLTLAAAVALALWWA